MATFRLRSAAMAKYYGHYECFHLSTSLKPLVVRSCVTISPDRWGRTEVIMHSFRYRYEGTAQVVENNLYIDLAGDGHHEFMQFIFNEPLTSEFDVLLGAYVAVTENRIPVIGKMLWHKIGQSTSCQRIPFEEADARITTFLSTPKNPIVVPKLDLPLLEEMPTQQSIGAEQSPPAYPEGRANAPSGSAEA